MDEGAVVEWIKGKTGARPARQGDWGSREEDVVSYSWSEGETEGIAEVHDNRLIRITFFSVAHGPTFRHIVDSLSTPSTVCSQLIPFWDALPGWAVGLDYPTRGFSVGATYHANSHIGLEGKSNGKDWTLVLTDDLRVDVVECYNPRSTIEEVVREEWLLSEQGVQVQMACRSPWPGFGAETPLK